MKRGIPHAIGTLAMTFAIVRNSLGCWGAVSPSQQVKVRVLEALKIFDISKGLKWLRTKFLKYTFLQKGEITT